MRLNPETGEALGCTVNGPLAVDGREIFDMGAGACWLNKDTVIFGRGDYGSGTGKYKELTMWSYHLPTGTLEEMTNSIPEVRLMGAQAAGGNRWVTYTPKELDRTGGGGWACMGSLKSRHSGATRNCMSWDGTIGLVPYAPDGVGMTLYAPDGRITEVPSDDPGIFYSMQVLGPTSVIWVHDGVFKGMNCRIPSVSLSGNLGGKRIVVNNEHWIVYWSNDYGLVVHPYDELEGYTLDTTGNMFWWDACEWNGKIRVVGSNHIRENPEDFRRFDVDITAKRQSFSRLDGGKGGGSESNGSATSRVYITGDYTAPAPKAAPRDSLVKPQLGLLEDDILYRLSLLATNVLQPLKDQFPGMVVQSGFREVNSGVGQHERGEAVDVTIPGASDQAILDMAKWMRDNLAFDQLILNFSNFRNTRPWIHVSFSPDALRGEVLTKNYADVFIPGLALITPETPTEAAAKRYAQEQQNLLIMSELQKIQDRQNRNTVITSYTDDPVSVEEGGLFGGLGSTCGKHANLQATAQCIHDKLWGIGTGVNVRVPSGLTFAQVRFQLVLRLAWLLRSQGCGLLVVPVELHTLFRSNPDAVNYNGYRLSAHQVCFADGCVYNVFPRAIPANPTYDPTWSEAGRVSQKFYVPALDPGMQYGTMWHSCPVPLALPSSGT
jgi:hypothetical protein